MITFEFKNKAYLNKILTDLDFSNPKNIKDINAITKQPLLLIRRRARANLKAQGSVISGALYDSMFVSNVNGKGIYGAVLETNSPYYSSINAGTKVRTTSRGYNRGSIRTSRKYKGKNELFRLGFSSRAMSSVETQFQRDMEIGISKLINKNIK